MSSAKEVLGLVKDAKSGLDIIIKSWSALQTYYRARSEQKLLELLNETMRQARTGEINRDEFVAHYDTLLNGNMEAREQFLKVVTQATHTLLESIDDRILPALGRLTAEYLEKINKAFFDPLEKSNHHLMKGVDPYFRGMCRLLKDLMYEEYEALRTMIKEMVNISTKPDYEGYEILQLNLTRPIAAKHADHEVGMLNPKETEKHGTRRYDWLTLDEHTATRVFSLLKLNGLGMDAQGGSAFGSVSGPPIILFDRDTVYRMHRTLNS